MSKTNKKKSHGSATPRMAVLALALCAAPALQAAPIVFSFSGSISSPAVGFTQGQNFTFSVTLNAAAANSARQTPAGTTCCASSIGWYEDVAAQPNLWSAVGGTGITGNWSFPAEYFTTSSLTMVTTAPGRTLWTGDTLQLSSQNIAATRSSGVFVNGAELVDFQVATVFLGLSAVNALGYDALFSNSLPDSTALFSGMAGTYARDPLFSSTGTLRVRDQSGTSTLRFTPTSVTITNLVPVDSVPEPASFALLGLGLAGLGAARRRKT